MFTFLRNASGNFWRRSQLAYSRTLEGWDWFVQQTRDVQWAIVLDMVCVFVGITLTMVFESNKPARYAFIPVMLIGAYLVRKLAGPVWFGELGLVAYRRVTDMLPEWARNVVRGSEGHDTDAVPHDIHPDAIWYDVSLGGHIFHILGTVWMWTHVVLYACGFLPVWKYDWLSVVVMATCFILFFVWTEAFVDIKKWRRRLAWVIGTHIAVMLLIMIIATALPGPFRQFTAWYDRQNTVADTNADATIAQTADDKRDLVGLRKQDSTYRSRYRAHQRDAAGRKNQFDTDWTSDMSDDWVLVVAQIEEIVHPEGEKITKSWMASVTEFPEEHPGWLVVAGLFLLAWGGKKTTAAHSGH